MSPSVYKICDRQDWRCARATAVFRGTALDRADGFIHLVAADQIEDVLVRQFAGRSGLVLLTVSVARLAVAGLDRALKWEPARGGRHVPHLYAALPVPAVAHEEDLPLETGGWHRLPPGLMPSLCQTFATPSEAGVLHGFR